MLKKILIVTLVAIAIPVCAKAASIETNPSNFNSNLSKVQPGDTLILENGNYPAFASNKNGTAQNPITVKAKNKWGAKVSASKDLLQLNDNYWVVDGIEFKKQDSKEEAAVRIRGNNNTLKNSKIYNKPEPYSYSTGALAYKNRTRDNGIVIAGNENIVDGNEIFGIHFGIKISSDSPQKQQFINNRIYGTAQSPIVLRGPANKPGQILIENNWLSYSGIEDGIQFDRGEQNAAPSIWHFVIRNNVFEGNAENAIDTKATKSVLIENNVFVETRGSNDGCYPECASSNKDAWKTANWLTADWDYSFPAISKGSNKNSEHLIIRNNVFYANGSGIRSFKDSRIYNNVFVFNNLFPPEQHNSVRDQHDAIIITTGGTHGLKNNIIGGHTDSEVRKTSGENLKEGNNIFFPYTGRNLKFDGYTPSSSNKILSGVGDVKFENVPDKLTDVDYTKYNFLVKNTSPGYKAGSELTRVTSSSNSDTITVEDALWFASADWAYGYQGDTITVNGQTANILDINGNNIKLNKSVNVSNGNKVYWGSNEQPNIGILEGTTVGFLDTTRPTPSPQTSPTPSINPKYDLDGNDIVDIRDLLELVKYIFQ